MGTHSSGAILMRGPRLARAVAVSILAIAMLACGDSGGATGFPGVTSISPGVWYMHSADSAPLPAIIGERLVGLAQEQTILDSAQLSVNALGRYEQRYWLRILISGALDRSDLIIDQGTWALETNVFVFSSTIRTRTFAVSSSAPGFLASQEQMLFHTAAPITSGTYRLFRP